MGRWVRLLPSLIVADLVSYFWPLFLILNRCSDVCFIRVLTHGGSKDLRSMHRLSSFRMSSQALPEQRFQSISGDYELLNHRTHLDGEKVLMD